MGEIVVDAQVQKMLMFEKRNQRIKNKYLNLKQFSYSRKSNFIIS